MGVNSQQGQSVTMIKVRPEVIETEEEAALRDAEEQEVTFLLMPMSTYRLLSERARTDGCTAAQVAESAFSQYLRPSKEEAADSPTKTETSESPSRPKPDLVIRRRR